MQARKVSKVLALAAVHGMLASSSLQAGEAGATPPNPCRLDTSVSSSLVTGLYIAGWIL